MSVASQPGECRNEVTLVGRVSQAPVERILPSGDALWVFRIVVPRPEGHGGRPGAVDALDCAVWGGRARRVVQGWRSGDVVRVAGAVRRRFFRAGGGGPASRVEVEVAQARLIRRGPRA